VEKAGAVRVAVETVAAEMERAEAEKEAVERAGTVRVAVETVAAEMERAEAEKEAVAVVAWRRQSRAGARSCRR
jgi:hypothetical protein